MGSANRAAAEGRPYKIYKIPPPPLLQRGVILSSLWERDASPSLAKRGQGRFSGNDGLIKKWYVYLF